jgi:hypothetical protein
VVPDFTLPEGPPSVLLDNSPPSSIIPTCDPDLTIKDPLDNPSNTPDVIPPATSDENRRKATLTKKGTKMDGTQAEFKQYYDHEISRELKQVCL